MFDVITMGSSTVDAFANAESELIEIKKADGEEDLIAYPLGSKIIINELRYDVGGNGVNTAVGLSRQGLNAAYLGKVGNDGNGSMITNRLEREGVKFIGGRGDQSGFSVILYSDIGHDRTILTYKGCNNDLHLDELDFSQLETKWFYFSSMLEDSFDTMKKLAEHAKDKDIKIAFNPSSTITRKGLDFVKPILEKADVLVVNDEEAEDLAGKGSPSRNLELFKSMGIGIIVMTMGEEGVLAFNGEDTYRAETHTCNIKETTGAGDACTSGFLAGLLKGKNFEDCLKMGMLNAESVLCHYGAQNKLLTAEELEQALQGDDRKIEKI